MKNTTNEIGVRVLWLTFLIPIFLFFLISCTTQQPIIIQKDSSTGASITGGQPTYFIESAPFKYLGNFSSIMPLVSENDYEGDYLLLYTDYVNHTGAGKPNASTNASKIQVQILGINSSDKVVREYIRVYGPLNGTGCTNGTLPDNTTPRVIDGCGNYTTHKYKYIVGIQVEISSNTTGLYYQSSKINLTVVNNRTRTQLTKVELINTTILGSRIFDGTKENALLFNETINVGYNDSSKFSYEFIGGTNNAVIATKMYCDVTAAKVWFNYTTSPVLNYWNSATPSSSMSSNNTNWTKLIEYQPIRYVRLTQINISNLTGSCYPEIKVLGYNT